jgi:peptide-methionine (S)-S-oxide reductase
VDPYHRPIDPRLRFRCNRLVNGHPREADSATDVPLARTNRVFATTSTSTRGKRGLMITSKLERAVLAGGCFWGMQDLIRKLPGVVNTHAGYTGGDVPNATYRNHGSHAEAIEIEFDPTRISYRDLLEFFFQIHDPTTMNRQGNDVGTSYRSEIFYVSEAQRDEALRTIDDLNASGLWPGRVVTKVSPAREFWEAEPEHQDYLERYPHGYTCHFPRPGWKLPRRAGAAT